MADSKTDYRSLEDGQRAADGNGNGKGPAEKIEEALGDFNDSVKERLGDVSKFGVCMSLVLHLAYAMLATVVILFLKTHFVDTEEKSFLATVLVGVNFTKLWVTLIGIIVPMILSVRALVTLETDDDRFWLEYWIAYAVYSFMTILFEEILFEDDWLWYAIQGSVYVWLYLPGLGGCHLLSVYLLKPQLLPLIHRVSSYVRKRVSLQLILGSMVNLAFIACLFFFFIPFCSTYIGTTLVGLSWPTLASLEHISKNVVAEVPPEGEEDKKKEEKKNTENGAKPAGTPIGGGECDSQWLTYWVVFAPVHFVDVWYDNLLDDSYWFRDIWYKLALPFIVWLQIPFFHGAEYIFLHIICPIFGLHVHRFQYAAAPWAEAPRAVNYVTYAKNMHGFIDVIMDAAGEGKKK
uniref:Uncharacterized protein n=1 Tax=Lotharella globosa TaxID=91324 RepID=A0A6U2YAP5_9EUKA